MLTLNKTYKKPQLITKSRKYTSMIMKRFLRYGIGLLVITLSCQAQNTQKIQVKDYRKGPMDLVVFPVGMEQPVIIGKIDDAGNILWSWPERISLTKDDRETFLVSASFASGLKCDGGELKEGLDAPSMPAGFIHLMKKGEQQGILYASTHDSVSLWLDDPMYNNAVTGSYCHWVYATRPVTMKGKCQETLEYEGKQIDGSIEYAIELQEGFNVLLSSIKNVYPTDPAIRASFPTYMEVKTIPDASSEMVWKVRWF
jgi:hypothetical protein